MLVSAAFRRRLHDYVRLNALSPARPVEQSPPRQVLSRQLDVARNRIAQSAVDGQSSGSAKVMML